MCEEVVLKVQTLDQWHQHHLGTLEIQILEAHPKPTVSEPVGFSKPSR